MGERAVRRPPERRAAPRRPAAEPSRRDAAAAPEARAPELLARAASGAGLAAFHGGGEPLSPAARSYFEPRFGRDLSAVRLHTAAAASGAAAALGARAFTVGSDVAFGAGEYRPETAPGRRLLAHELAHTLQPDAGRWLRRSPLSDSVEAAFTADPTIEALLERLSQSDVQTAQGDVDVDAAVARLLAARPDDLWVAQRVRQGMLGQTTGALGPRVRGRPVPRPIEAFFFRGAATRRALVIAGVHGTERQGIEVAQRLIADLQTQQPHFTVVVVPSLFPDNAARRGRESGSTPTNRNFPRPDEDLAAARAAGGGTAVDASTRRGRRTRAILPENLLLLELMERFRPERIISIHGTWRAGAGGVFYDPRSLRPDEVQAARQWAAGQAYMRVLPERHHTPEGRQELRDLEDRLFHQRLGDLLGQASDADRALSLAAAQQIDTATTAITGRDSRHFANREGESQPVPAADLAGRQAHPSVAGNVGPTGALDRASWSGSGSGGVSLGGYAPPRGMSVFTVEPPINRNSADYPTGLDSAVDAAERQVELQSYADAVRTVLLGTP